MKPRMTISRARMPVTFLSVSKMAGQFALLAPELPKTKPRMMTIMLRMGSNIWRVRCRENKSSGDERGVDDQAQRSLVLAGNPVAGTGDQVEVVTIVVAEDVLQGSGLRRVEGHLRHPVAKGVALIVYYQHLVAAV